MSNKKLLFVCHEKALFKLAEEIAQYGIPVGSRKINGKYIQSHLLSRLDGMFILSRLCFY